jgi:aryl-alcohol dehydrogenase-like predicted oxidoreductase
MTHGPSYRADISETVPKAVPTRDATDAQPCRVDRVLTRRLGANGPEVSVVGLGANNFGWRIGLDESRLVVDAAAEEGITLLDTADVYGATESEQFLGEILVGRRARFVVVTKFGHPVPGGPDLPRSSRAYLRWAIEGSLARLRTDVVDVYMLHRPDGVTPIGETIEALGELVREGKARYVGVSNVDVAEIEEAATVALAGGIPLVCVESRYSLIRRGIEADVIPACERHGLGLLPYYPLESGLLTGKYRRGQEPPSDSRFVGNAAVWPAERWLTDEAFDGVEALERYAAAQGVPLLDVAIGGLAAMPAVGSVIAGATTPAQVRANARAGRWEPSADALAALRALGPG